MGRIEQALTRWVAANSLADDPLAASAALVAAKLDGAKVADTAVAVLAAELRHTVNALRATLDEKDTEDDQLSRFLESIAAPELRADDR